MIQELLGGSSASTRFLGERNISSIAFSSPISSSTYPTSTPILTSSSITTNLVNSSNSPNTNTNINTTTTTTTTTNNNNNNNNNNNDNNSLEANNNISQQNLRCPRCDSTNTKFCYYNNYNLTQPRHFCKTCRRYWTKGGTLRNVPIGGGCRKNKTTMASGSSTSSGLVKSSSNAMAKAKATLSSELLVNGNPGFLGSGLLLDHHPDLQSGFPNPILWPTSLPQNSHILSLLRGSSTQFQNPNPNPNPISNIFSPVKTEGGTTSTTLGLDSYGNGGPSNLLRSNPMSNQHQGNGFSSGFPDCFQNNGNNNSNILELHHRLKSSSNYNSYCGNDQGSGTVVLGNMIGSTSTILDSAPVVGDGDHNFGGYGFMNSSPAIISGWSDFPTVPINGAFP